MHSSKALSEIKCISVWEFSILGWYTKRNWNVEINGLCKKHFQIQIIKHLLQVTESKVRLLLFYLFEILFFSLIWKGFSLMQQSHVLLIYVFSENTDFHTHSYIYMLE